MKLQYMNNGCECRVERCTQRGGPQGVPGPAGARGPQGEPGPGVPFSVYSATNPAPQTFVLADMGVNDNTVLHFTTPVMAVNPHVTQLDPTTFSVTQPGVYLVTYRLSIRGDTIDFYDAQYKLTLRGIPLDYTAVYAGQGVGLNYSTVGAQVYLNLIGGDWVRVELVGMGGSAAATYTVSNPFISFQKVA